MNELFILTIVDTNNVGFNPKDVEVFPNYESAEARMTELYNEECERQGLDPNATDDFDQMNGEWYAYCHGVYWDIFVKSVGVID